MRGILAGALALIVLQTVVRYAGSTNRVAGLMREASDAVDRFMDPTRPAIGDHRPAQAPASLAGARNARPAPLAYPAPTYPG